MRFAADENFDGRILDGLRARMPTLDIVRVQDTELYQSPDVELLAWLAVEGRILLTHDVQTMPGYVFERVRAGLNVHGVIAVHKQDIPMGALIDDLEIAISAGTPEDFENQVKYIPI
jgi:hypothetical protein